MYFVINAASMQSLDGLSHALHSRPCSASGSVCLQNVYYTSSQQLHLGVLSPTIDDDDNKCLVDVNSRPRLLECSYASTKHMKLTWTFSQVAPSTFRWNGIEQQPCLVRYHQLQLRACFAHFISLLLWCTFDRVRLLIGFPAASPQRVCAGPKLQCVTGGFYSSRLLFFLLSLLNTDGFPCFCLWRAFKSPSSCVWTMSFHISTLSDFWQASVFFNLLTFNIVFECDR